MASGDTLAVFDALASRPPGSNYPQIDLRNGHAVLDFDDTADEASCFPMLLPASYAGSGFLIRLLWSSSTSVAGNVRWQAAIEGHGAGSDLDSDNYGPSVSSTSAAPNNTGELATTSIVVAAAAPPSAGDALRIRIGRLATDAADTMTGDAELFAVELREA